MKKNYDVYPSPPPALPTPECNTLFFLNGTNKTIIGWLFTCTVSPLLLSVDTLMPDPKAICNPYQQHYMNRLNLFPETKYPGNGLLTE